MLEFCLFQNIKIKSVKTQVVAGTKYIMEVETSEAGEVRFVISIDIEVSRLAVVCPCLFRITILCYSLRPKLG